MRETREGRIDLNKLNLSAHIVESILNYMYTGRVLIDDNNVKDLIIASDFFLLSQLKDMACTFLQRRVTPHEAVSVRVFADKYDCKELAVQAENLIMSNFVDISKTVEFKNLHAEQVLDIVSSDRVFATEEEIFEALLEWTFHDLENRQECFPLLFSCIRLNHISGKFLTDIVEHNELVKNSSACLNLIVARKNLLSSATATTGAKPREGSPALIAVGGYQTGHGISGTTICLFTYLNKWFPLVPMETARYGHGLCVCNGYIYAVGGFSSVSPHSAERYDPRTNHWSNIAPMCKGVTNPGLVQYREYLYVVGGASREPTNKIQRYSPLADIWDLVHPMHVDRDGPCVIGTDKYLYAIGGYSNIHGYLNSVERYDIIIDKWVFMSPMNKRRYNACAAYINKKIYITGGKNGTVALNSCEMYFPDMDQWQIMSYMRVPRFGAGLAVIDNKMYVCGGRGNALNIDNGIITSSIECCDVDKQEWEFVGEMPTPMYGLACCSFLLYRNILAQSKT